MTRRLPLCLALVAPALLAGACRNTADGARKDAQRAAREAQEAAEDAKREVERAAREARRAADDARKEARQAMDDAKGAMREAESSARQAGREAQRSAREAAADLDEAKQLVDVRAALAVSKEISAASDIDVRADEAGRTVILAGTVPTAAERDVAGRIARESADGLRVDNRLRVAPRR